MSAPRAIPKSRRMLGASQGEHPTLARSPKESPPTLKKKLCRLINGSVSVGPLSDINDLEALINGTKGLATRDKKVQALPASPSSSPTENSPLSVVRSNSILKRAPSTKPADSPAASRRVKFAQQVTVFLMSDDGDVFGSGSESLSEAQQENTRPVPRRYKGLLGMTELTQCAPPAAPSSRATEDVVEASQIDFLFSEDPERGTMLKFVVALGHEYKPDDIVVKANVSGTRVRLVASRPASYPDGSIRMEQLSRRYMLPAEVDPYQVTARLDVKGSLTVDAPLLRGAADTRPGVLTDSSNKLRPS